MQYPFLVNNDLILVDYLPGSSGQMLLRLWAELDRRLSYDNQKVISNTSIRAHQSTREIDYDILIPKRITNWFLDRCYPSTTDDYANYFEFLGTTLLALQQKWKRGENTIRFYDNDEYEMVGYRILYGIHTWEKIVPISDLISKGFNIRCYSIVPETERGLRYQFDRCTLCYPGDPDRWKTSINTFNAKACTSKVDFCTMLVDSNSDAIIDWLRSQLESDFREEKVPRVREILDIYYDEITKPLGISHV